jgi:hypothetical protein
MIKFTIRHEINSSADKFWALFFDKSAMEDLYRVQFAYPDYSVIEQTDRDSTLLRKVSMKPKMALPGPVQKLLGENFCYIEEGTFQKATKIWTWKRIPSTLADKLRVEGVLRIDPINDTKIYCIAEWVIEAKVFGIGGLLESTFEKQAREDEDKLCNAINQKLAAG